MPDIVITARNWDEETQELTMTVDTGKKVEIRRTKPEETSGDDKPTA